MTDRTASRSDARKRNAARARDAGGESFNDFIAHVYRWAAPSWRPVTYSTRTHTIDPETGHFTPIDQEPDMTAKDRHDELVALLTEIRDRLPEPEGAKGVADLPDATGCPWCDDPNPLPAGCPGGHKRAEPAPADDLPGEPVDRDEALARVIFGDAYGSHEGLRQAQLDVALKAREHIEAERESRERAAKGEQG